MVERSVEVTGSTRSHHWRAALQALFVTFLWSTSWVLIKIGLADIPALTFAGLRYYLAFLCLLPFLLQQGRLQALRSLTPYAWLRLIALGLLLYAITQGSQFVALSYLPAITTSLVLSFSPVVVALVGVLVLRERPHRRQWSGMALSMAGIVAYFYPIALPAAQTAGLVAIILGMGANALSSILGRSINRRADLDPLSVTVTSMGIGGVVLLGGGILTQGLPHLSALNWLTIAWLAVINTAFAFTLWNHTLRTLSALESSILNNTMLVQITLLAWLFLGEQVSSREAVGLALTAIGALIVQLRRSPS